MKKGSQQEGATNIPLRVAARNNRLAVDPFDPLEPILQSSILHVERASGVMIRFASTLALKLSKEYVVLTERSSDCEPQSISLVGGRGKEGLVDVGGRYPEDEEVDAASFSLSWSR